MLVSGGTVPGGLIITILYFVFLAAFFVFILYGFKWIIRWIVRIVVKEVREELKKEQ